MSNKLNKLNWDTALNNIENDSTISLIDVRTFQEYKQGHVEGSENIEVSELSETFGFDGDKRKTIYLYCLSGVRSKTAGMFLLSLGYENVFIINGGIEDYKGDLKTL